MVDPFASVVGAPGLDHAMTRGTAGEQCKATQPRHPWETRRRGRGSGRWTQDQPTPRVNRLRHRGARFASKRGADPGQVYASLQKAGRLAEIEQSITEDKVFDWLMARNEVAG